MTNDDKRKKGDKNGMRERAIFRKDIKKCAEMTGRKNLRYYIIKQMEKDR